MVILVLLLISNLLKLIKIKFWPLLLKYAQGCYAFIILFVLSLLQPFPVLLSSTVQYYYIFICMLPVIIALVCVCTYACYAAAA